MPPSVGFPPKYQISRATITTIATMMSRARSAPDSFFIGHPRKTNKPQLIAEAVRIRDRLQAHCSSLSTLALSALVTAMRHLLPFRSVHRIVNRAPSIRKVRSCPLEYQSIDWDRSRFLAPIGSLTPSVIYFSSTSLRKTVPEKSPKTPQLPRTYRPSAFFDWPPHARTWRPRWRFPAVEKTAFWLSGQPT